MMMNDVTDAVRLMRTEVSPDGVFGELYLPGYYALRLCTMEDDWHENMRGSSCIPAGIYTLHRTVFHKHNVETFEVTGVPNRSRILIHPANTEEDVEGCIGIGLRTGSLVVPVDEDTGATAPNQAGQLLRARHAFHRFMDAMTGYDCPSLSSSAGHPASQVTRRLLYDPLNAAWPACRAPANLYRSHTPRRADSGSSPHHRA
jgi:hypothetical protein